MLFFFFFLFLTRVASAMVCLHSNRTMNKTDIFIPKKGNLSYRVPPRDKQIQTTAARGRLVCPRSEALPDYLTQRGQPRNHAHTTKAVDCIYILRIYINMCVTVISKEKEAIILRVRCLSGERL